MAPLGANAARTPREELGTVSGQVENAKGVTPRTHLEDKTVRTFGAAEQPIKVETDLSGVIINVPDAKEKKADTSATPTGSE